jgi:hypothetical protein
VALREVVWYVDMYFTKRVLNWTKEKGSEERALNYGGNSKLLMGQ